MNILNKINCRQMFIYRSFSTTKNFQNYKNIPGPKYYSFLGSINDILTFGSASNLHKTINEMHQKYGSVFRVKINGHDSIFISSSDSMRAIFAHEGKYPRHPLPQAWVYFNEKYNCKRGLFFMDGPEWLRYRKTLNTLLVNQFPLYTNAIEAACDKCLNLIDSNIIHKKSKMSQQGTFTELLNLEDLLYRWSIDVILRMMVNSTNDLIVPESIIDEFVFVVKKIFETSVPLQSIPPHLADAFNIKVWKSFSQSVSFAIKLGNNIVDYIIKNYSDNNTGLLYELKTAGLNNEEISRIFVDLIIAAGDTTSFATQWLFYLVSKNKTAQQIIQKGLNNTTSSDTPQVKGAVRETLRLYPPATFIGRIIAEDCLLSGYQIPKNTLCLISLYTAGRSIENFSNPLIFDVERWARSTKHNHDIFKPQASLPFAMGSRSCIGRKIALYQMHDLIAKVLKKYELSLLNEHEVDSIMKMIIAPAEKIKIGLKAKIN